MMHRHLAADMGGMWGMRSVSFDTTGSTDEAVGRWGNGIGDSPRSFRVWEWRRCACGELGTERPSGVCPCGVAPEGGDEARYVHVSSDGASRRDGAFRKVPARRFRSHVRTGRDVAGSDVPGR